MGDEVEQHFAAFFVAEDVEQHLAQKEEEHLFDGLGVQAGVGGEYHRRFGDDESAPQFGCPLHFEQRERLKETVAHGGALGVRDAHQESDPPFASAEAFGYDFVVGIPQGVQYDNRRLYVHEAKIRKRRDFQSLKSQKGL